MAWVFQTWFLYHCEHGYKVTVYTHETQQQREGDHKQLGVPFFQTTITEYIFFIIHFGGDVVRVICKSRALL